MQSINEIKRKQGRPEKPEDEKIPDIKAYMKEYNKTYYQNRRILKDKADYKRVGFGV
jgi:hypothetical protein